MVEFTDGEIIGLYVGIFVLYILWCVINMVVAARLGKQVWLIALLSFALSPVFGTIYIPFAPNKGQSILADKMQPAYCQYTIMT